MTNTELHCLDDHNVNSYCKGSVEYRMPLSGTGKSFPRCEHHWEERLKTQEEINRKYAPFSDVPPADFDPADAGESWPEDY